RAADGGRRHPDDGVGRLLDPGVGDGVDANVFHTVPCQRLHSRLLPRRRRGGGRIVGPATASWCCRGVWSSAALVTGRVVRHLFLLRVLRVDTGRRPGGGAAVGAIGTLRSLVGPATRLGAL